MNFPGNNNHTLLGHLLWSLWGCALWLARGSLETVSRRFPAPVAAYEAFRLNQLSWLRNSAKETAKNLFPAYPPRILPSLALVDEAALMTISLTLKCLAHGAYQVDDGCRAFNRPSSYIIFSRDDQRRRIHFGYSFVVNSPARSTEDYASLILYLAEQCWPHVAATLKDIPTYEQFHVGYGSGGTLATLVARRFLLASRNYSNVFNHVKVLTVDEIPLYPKNVLLDLIGSQNHLIIDLNKRAEEHCKKLVSVHPLSDYSASADDGLKLPESLVGHHSSWTLRGIEGASVKSKDYQATEKSIAKHLAMVAKLGHDLPNMWGDVERSLSNHAHATCARQLETQISRFLPHLSEVQIVCKAKMQTVEESTEDRFRIDCETASKGGSVRETHQLASYLARMSSFDDYQKACAAIASVVQPKKRWSRCIHGLASQAEELSMISPYRPNSEPAKCRYFNTAKVDFNWAFSPRGCVVVPEAQDEFLSQINQQSQRLFLSLIPKYVAFPALCRGLIEPLLLGGAETAALRSAIAEVSNYLRKTLGAAPDSLEYVTKERFLSREPFIVKGEAIIKCLTEDPRIINCQLEANQWITGACPKFCQRSRLNEQASYLCHSVITCPTQQAHIVVGGAYLPQVRRSPVKYARNVLKNADLADYALFNFRRTGMLSVVSNTFVGIFLDGKAGGDQDPSRALSTGSEGRKRKGWLWW